MRRISATSSAGFVAVDALMKMYAFMWPSLWHSYMLLAPVLAGMKPP